MRVKVFVKATENSEQGREPTPEMMAAFEAMDRFTEEWRRLATANAEARGCLKSAGRHSGLCVGMAANGCGGQAVTAPRRRGALPLRCP